jgi:hypothetical protein
VPLEVLVNGRPVAKTEIAADGKQRPVSFDVQVDASAWIALRILPSSHTNPVWVTVGGKPVRVKESLEWCVKAVEQCYQQKVGRVRLPEQGEMKRAYDFAKGAYQQRLAELP